MKNYRVFDTHCDTLCRLADRGGTFLKNEYHVDKERMMQYKAYTQIFACFIQFASSALPAGRFQLCPVHHILSRSFLTKPTVCVIMLLLIL